MEQSAKQRQLNKLLDSVEISLTPKQWAISYADDIRRYPTYQEALNALVEGAYLESALVKPYHALSQQAQDRRLGSQPHEVLVRSKLTQNLVTEYHVLTTLIRKINADLEAKCVAVALMSLQEISNLDLLMLTHNFALAASKAAGWIKYVKRDTGGRENQRQQILSQLATLGQPQDMTSMMRSWSAFTAGVFIRVCAYEAAVQIVQDKYFCGHSILSQDHERVLTKIKQLLLAAIRRFNRYLARALWSGASEGIGPLDVEALQKIAIQTLVDSIVKGWVAAAQDQGADEILLRTDDPEVLWERIQKKVGANS
jgi:hypothetical protein